MQRSKFIDELITNGRTRSEVGQAAMRSAAVRFRSVGLATALLFILNARATAQPAPALPPQVLAQIEALTVDKLSRSPAHRKVDSQIVQSLKMRRGEPLAAGVLRLRANLPDTNAQGTVLDLRADVSTALLAQLRALGGEILDVSAVYGNVRIRVDLRQVEAIASLPDVAFVMPKQEFTSRTTSYQERRYQAEPTSAGAGTLDEGYVTHVGIKTSEGDVTHRANVARETFGVNGAGVKIGVLSDGVRSLGASQSFGDLGPVTVLAGQTGSGDEGTAMLEIVHDLAPAAELYFATAGPSLSAFAQNIRNLAALGCHIIVDDVRYFVESPFQDGQTGTSQTNGGIVAQAVKDVSNAGVLYFSSAGNSGNKTDGSSGTWEGDFLSAGAATGALVGLGLVHDFGGLTYNRFLTNTLDPVTLFWSDPLGGAVSDYDLYVLNSTGTQIVAASTNFQAGTQDPYEQISGGFAGERVVIVRFAGADRFLHLDTGGSQLLISTAGAIRGHAATTATNSFAVAATPAQSPGPYPGAFNGSHQVEGFSSDGPRRIFFASNGSPFSPGNVTSSGGIVLRKPDFTAADGVSVTGVGGFPSSFYGTSAAAAHAAAIAALVKSGDLAQTPAVIRALLLSSVIDIEAPGMDRDAGAGILMADVAVGGVIAPGRRTGDFNGDGRDDLLWRNVQTGDVAVWVMGGATAVQAPVLSAGVLLVWQIVAVGDLDADRKADLVWRDLESGAVAVWLMNGVAVKQSVAISTVPLSWQTVGIGDLNGDARDDLLWRNVQTGDVVVWLMNGATVTQGSMVSSRVPLVFEIAGVGDLDADGRADLVWRDSQSGAVAVWLMNGVTVKQSVAMSTVPLSWQIVGVGDVNADSRDDLVWRNVQTGDVAVWLMNGATVIQGPLIASGVPLAWQFATLRDINGDGKVDLVWRHAQSGDVAAWLMNGTAIVQHLVVAPGVPAVWQLSGVSP